MEGRGMGARDLPLLPLTCAATSLPCGPRNAIMRQTFLQDQASHANPPNKKQETALHPPETAFKTAYENRRLETPKPVSTLVALCFCGTHHHGGVSWPRDLGGDDAVG